MIGDSVGNSIAHDGGSEFRRITDGTLVIWKGLSDDHLRAVSKRFSHVRDYLGTN